MKNMKNVLPCENAPSTAATAVEVLFIISEALYVADESKCRNGHDVAFRQRKMSLNTVACEFALRAIDTCATGSDSNRSISTLVRSIKRHLLRCQSSLVCGGDIISIYDENNDSFICNALVLPEQFGCISLMAGSDISDCNSTSKRYVKIGGVTFDVLNHKLTVKTKDDRKDVTTYRFDFTDFKAKFRFIDDNDESKMMQFLTEVISFYMGVEMPWEAYLWCEMGRKLILGFDDKMHEMNSLRSICPSVDFADILTHAIKFQVQNDNERHAISLLNIGILRLVIN